MSSRSEAEKQKQIQEKCQAILGNLLREEDNKYCVDCDAKGPRWAAWNLGIFLCIRCAGIHRNLGVHISKVKSVNLDTWTPEQVAYLQQMGNSQARAVYEANLPDNFRRPQTDSSLEAFIRSKYEQKKYIAKEWVPPPPPKPAFDIDEDRKKEKERKKTRTKAAGNVEIPVLPQQPPAALPRPHGTVQQTSASKTMQELGEITVQKTDSSASDLLGLGDVSSDQKCDDIFDVFLSADRPSNGPSSSPASANMDSVSTNANKSYDTTDLFSEMVIPTTTQSKMTKESILSLYGSAQSQQPQVPPVYGLPSGMYVGQQSYAPVNVTRFPAVPSQPVVQPVIPNGFPGVVPHVAGVQLHQQMANLQIQGNIWASGVTVAPVPSSGVMIATDPLATNMTYPPSGSHNISSTNLWQ